MRAIAPFPTSLTARLWPWIVAQAALVLAVGWLAAGTPINHDSAGYLNFAQEMLRGRVPYVDVVDLNPPLAAYWCVPAAWLAGATGWSAPVVFQLFVGGLVLATLVALLALLRRSRAAYTPPELGVVGLAWGFASLVVLERGHFGQREHLFVLGYLPFLACRMLRYEGQRAPSGLAVGVGLAAGAVVCLKPTFVAAAAGVELVFLVMHRTWRPLLRAEVVAAAIFAIAYALHWYVAPAAMREAFFHRWVPFVVDRYGAYDSPYSQVVLRLGGRRMGRWWVLLGTAATVVAAWQVVRRPGDRRRPRVLLAGLVTLSVLSLAAYVQQHKGWPYHIVPFVFSGLITLAVVAISARRGVVDRRKPRVETVFAVAPFALGLALTLWLVWQAAGRRIPPPPIADPLAGAIDRWTQRGDTVLVMSTAIDPAQPLLVQMDRRPGSRYSCMYPIPMLYWSAGPQPSTGGTLYRSFQDAPTEERMFLEDLADDVLTRSPKLVAVEAQPGCQGCPPEFNLLAYLRYNGWFEKVIGPRYVEAGDAGKFRLYVRR